MSDSPRKINDVNERDIYRKKARCQKRKYMSERKERRMNNINERGRYRKKAKRQKES